ncbi:poly-beta-1,6-N-acetyl-D-glucosamine biosynthesis protein PgaD [Luteimonas sp. XNQY3]|nr:poly-beta-1,6-N-acetyl-D-glucosamine biosynthesis protein PgaD [Luteimonas sp. XNQY3]MCD9007574.1 poly-beta-1,6-N-acetyl-D-glucosamine biosynthesis protein PgaD [Luteimonas sp. XNQY3]
MNPPIIDHSQRRSRGRRTAASMLTAAAWALYAWLWVPAVTLIAWLVGVRSAFVQLYMARHQVEPFLLLALPVITLVCTALLIGWAEYNRARFVNRERRTPRADIDEDAVRTALGATTALARKLRSARIISVSLDDDARPLAVSRPGET